MALNIKSPEADRLARELADATGESITTAVSIALQERLARLRKRPKKSQDYELDEIWRRASRLRPRSLASDDELLGYDEHGAFD